MREDELASVGTYILIAILMMANVVIGLFIVVGGLGGYVPSEMTMLLMMCAFALVIFIASWIVHGTRAMRFPLFIVAAVVANIYLSPQFGPYLS